MQKSEKVNQCGETCERAQLCAACGKEVAPAPVAQGAPCRFPACQLTECPAKGCYDVALTPAQIDRAVAAERDALLDHIYDHGTTAEGVMVRVRKLARAAIEATSQEGGAA